jgi:hypothetical protein
MKKCPYEAISATGKVFCLHEDKKSKYCHLKNCPLNIEGLGEFLQSVKAIDGVKVKVSKSRGRK